jgi:hypothetical protein
MFLLILLYILLLLFTLKLLINFLHLLSLGIAALTEGESRSTSFMPIEILFLLVGIPIAALTNNAPPLLAPLSLTLWGTLAMIASYALPVLLLAPFLYVAHRFKKPPNTTQDAKQD